MHNKYTFIVIQQKIFRLYKKDFFYNEKTEFLLSYANYISKNRLLSPRLFFLNGLKSKVI